MYPLFYDKYHGNHCADNKVTSGVSIEDLNDGSYDYYSEEDAVNFYNTNKKFNTDMKIPQGVIDSDMYKVDIYKKKVKGLDAIYTVVRVDTNLLKEYVKIGDPTKIPEFDFLRQLCRFSMLYENSAKLLNNTVFSSKYDNRAKIEKNEKYITDKASMPVDYTNDPAIESPDFLKSDINLYQYQRCSIQWMLNRENNPKSIRYSLNDEVQIGDVYYDIYNQVFRLEDDKKRLDFSGGCLIDEVGLGKTVQMMTLSLLNRSKKEDEIFNDHLLYSKATLVFCPNQLCGQWKREFKKMISDNDITVVPIMTKRDFDKYTYYDLLTADFVLVSFSFIDNLNFAAAWLDGLSKIKSYHKKEWFDKEHKLAKEHFQKLGENAVKDIIETLTLTNPLFQLIYWHRIIVDEFHKVHTDTKCRSMKNILKHIHAKHRWVMTATPFITKGSLLSIIDYLSGYTNEDSDNILTREEFMDFLSYDLCRTNNKKSIKEYEAFELPPVEDEVQWLTFSQTERTIYNAYLANPNNNKWSVYLRQLCCHPQLADETKLALSNCKTLKEIEMVMVGHYRKEMEEAQKNVDHMQNRIDKQEDKILRTKVIRREKFLLRAKKSMEEDGNEDEEIEIDEDKIDFDNYDLKTPLASLISLITGKKSDVKDTTQEIEGMEEYLADLQQRLVKLNELLRGKTATFNFFNNVIERLSKAANRQPKVLKGGPNLDLKSTNLLDYLSDSDEESDDDSEEEDEEDILDCAICASEIPESNIGVTTCGHIFCHACLKDFVSQKGKCPYCSKKLNKDIDIIAMSYTIPKKKEIPETEEDKAFTKLINEVGTKLANLIRYLKTTKNHVIIFSQWDDMLRRTGRVLTEHGIKNIFCKGNCYQRDKAIREFNGDDKMRVIMLSSEQAAAGTNLTKATRIILMDPIYGDYKYRKDQERQAIGRAHRMGQTKTVKVIRMIIKDTIEEEIHRENVKMDEKHRKELEAEDSESDDE
jgi:SNF2 family DNA or RNA helicase